MDDPRDLRREMRPGSVEDRGGGAGIHEAMGSVVRMLASGLGIVAIVIGLYFATKIFLGVYDAVKSPEDFQALFAQWVDAVGGKQLDVKLESGTFPLAHVLATAVLGLATMVLAWIATGIMLTGAKIVSWTSSEREAVKRILKYTFGSGKAPTGVGDHR